jgi:hypothetical protein
VLRSSLRTSSTSAWATGARKPIPGESTYKPFKPLRREAGYLADPVVLPRAFCCTRTMGISGYPAFPAPSFCRRGSHDRKARAVQAARSRRSACCLKK